MRILVVCHRFPPFGLAGVERQTEQSAAALAARGHTVTVLTRRPSAAPAGPVLERRSHDGVPVIQIGGPLTSMAEFPRGQSRMGGLFERLLVEIQPDVVLLSHLLDHSALYVAAAHRWRIAVVAEVHDFYFACERAHLERASGGRCDGPAGGVACATHCFPDVPAGRWALRTHVFRRALEGADHVVCPSHFVADYLTRAYHLRRPPRIIGNGVQLEEGIRAHSSGSKALRLASVGVVTPHKGLHVIIEALRRARLNDVELSAFGPGTEPYLSEMRRLAQQIDGLSFRAYGAFEPSELPLLLSHTDALVVASTVWETFSRVTREALALGVPVIASRLGALPEAIRDGENGLLFDPDRPAELAAILSHLAQDETLLAGLRAGIARSDWLSNDERADELEAVLREAESEEYEQASELGELREMTGMLDALSLAQARS